MYDTYMYKMYNDDYLPHTRFCFYLIGFQLNTYFSFQFCVFYGKITLLKDWFLKKRFKTVAFLHKT